MDKSTNEIYKNMTVSLQLKHFDMLEEMDKAGRQQSSLVREAIELLYAKKQTETTVPQAA